MIIVSQEDQLEKFRVQLTKFELKMRDFLKKMMNLAKNDKKKAKKQLDYVRSRYLLNENTILMFRRLELLHDYSLLLRDYNNALDEI